MGKIVRLRLPPFHEEQGKFVNDPARFVVAAAGTKLGKTYGLCEWLLREAWNMPGCLAWWTSPTYRQSKIAFNLIGTWIPPVRVNVLRADLMYELLRSDGTVRSRIEFRSADKPESLRGEGVHRAVVDEAAYWNYDSFISVLTTLTRTRGSARIISTPKGKNWFYEAWRRGLNREEWPEWASYQLPTSCNPFVPRESIEEARRILPPAVFQQEYEAQFLDEAAGVFRNVIGNAKVKAYDKPIYGVDYVMGIDWAKQDDYTVIMLAERDTHEVVHIDRFTGLDWNAQINKAVQMARAWNNASVLMDSTGVGDVPLDSMLAVYPHVQGYTIGNNAAKVALIQKLQFAMDRGDITYPKDKTLLRELEIYEYTMSNTGKWIFGAPEGFNDDCVISLALVNWLLNESPLVYKFRNVRGI